MLDETKYYISALWNAAKEYGVLRTAVDSWHVLRFETKDEGGPVAWTKSVLEDLRKDDSSVSLKVAYLTLMFGTPYGASAILASKLPDSWFKRRDHDLREEQYATKLAEEFYHNESP